MSSLLATTTIHADLSSEVGILDGAAAPAQARSAVRTTGVAVGAQGSPDDVIDDVPAGRATATGHVLGGFQVQGSLSSEFGLAGSRGQPNAMWSSAAGGLARGVAPSAEFATQGFSTPTLGYGRRGRSNGADATRSARAWHNLLPLRDARNELDPPPPDQWKYTKNYALIQNLSSHLVAYDRRLSDLQKDEGRAFTQYQEKVKQYSALSDEKKLSSLGQKLMNEMRDLLAADKVSGGGLAFAEYQKKAREYTALSDEAKESPDGKALHAKLRELLETDKQQTEARERLKKSIEKAKQDLDAAKREDEEAMRNWYAARAQIRGRAELAERQAASEWRKLVEAFGGDEKLAQKAEDKAWERWNKSYERQRQRDSDRHKAWDNYVESQGAKAKISMARDVRDQSRQFERQAKSVASIDPKASREARALAEAAMAHAKAADKAARQARSLSYGSNDDALSDAQVKANSLLALSKEELALARVKVDAAEAIHNMTSTNLDERIAMHEAWHAIEQRAEANVAEAAYDADPTRENQDKWDKAKKEAETAEGDAKKAMDKYADSIDPKKQDKDGDGTPDSDPGDTPKLVTDVDGKTKKFVVPFPYPLCTFFKCPCLCKCKPKEQCWTELKVEWVTIPVLGTGVEKSGVAPAAAFPADGAGAQGGGQPKPAADEQSAQDANETKDVRPPESSTSLPRLQDGKSTSSPEDMSSSASPYSFKAYLDRQSPVRMEPESSRQTIAVAQRMSSSAYPYSFDAYLEGQTLAPENSPSKAPENSGRTTDDTASLSPGAGVENGYKSELDRAQKIYKNAYDEWWKEVEKNTEYLLEDADFETTLSRLRNAYHNRMQLLLDVLKPLRDTATNSEEIKALDEVISFIESVDRVLKFVADADVLYGEISIKFLRALVWMIDMIGAIVFGLPIATYKAQTRYYAAQLEKLLKTLGAPDWIAEGASYGLERVQLGGIESIEYLFGKLRSGLEYVLDIVFMPFDVLYAIGIVSRSQHAYVHELKRLLERILEFFVMSKGAKVLNQAVTRARGGPPPLPETSRSAGVVDARAATHPAEIMGNPNSLRAGGKLASPSELGGVRQYIKDSGGEWAEGPLEKGRYKGLSYEDGGGVAWREMKNGEPTGNHIRYNPGTPREGHFGGKPYWTVIRNDPATGGQISVDVTEDGVFPR